MKHLLTLCMVVLVSFTMLSQKEYDHFQIQVDGLGCPFCAYGLEKKFKEFKGLKKIVIDIESGNFEFDYPEDKKLTMDAIIDQVNKSGYTPKIAKITRFDGFEETFTASENNAAISNKNMRTIIVQGNCEMCKARIEKSVLSIAGIESAFWNKDTKELQFTGNKSVSQKEVAQQIANAGHDNELITATQEVYDNLPPCCLYKK